VVVAHGTNESFTISFRAKGESRKDGQISIFTSSGDAPVVLTVRASTIKVQTELTASEAAIDFEDVAVGGVGKQGTAGHRWWRDYAPRASPPSSPFYYYGTPLLHGMAVANLAVVIGVGAVALALGSLRFARKDIGV